MVCASAAVGACGDPAGEVDRSYTVRDSAGVSIVTSDRPAWGDSTRWRVAPEPVLDLTTTGSGPDHEFYGVSDALRLADGSIAVAEERSGTVRFFSSDGGLVRAVRREGEGPGEFLGIRDLEPYRGDSIAVFDVRVGRVTVLGGDREPVRSVPMPGVASVRSTPDGNWIVVFRGDPAELEGVEGSVRMGLGIGRLAAAGGTPDTIATVPGGEEIVIAGDFVRPPFPVATYVDVIGDEVLIADAAEPAYRLVDAEGRLETAVRAPALDEPMTATLWEAERDVRYAFFENADAARELFERLPVPERRPAFAGLVVDGAGNVWLAEDLGQFRNMLGAEPRAWTVFDPDGVWLGDVDLPGRFVVHEIGDDYVLGTLRDDLDVERVQMLRLVK